MLFENQIYPMGRDRNSQNPHEQETTMFLTALAAILFIFSKVADHYERKYSGMSDGSRIARFRREYWRTSKAIPTTPFVGGLLCVWFETKDQPGAHAIAMGLLTIGSLVIMAAMMMCVVKLFEIFFG